MNVKRLVLASTFAISSLLSPMMASAAIPCVANPLIETPETQIMPLIYRELPIDFIDLMRGYKPVDRPELIPTPFNAAATAEVPDNAANSRSAAEGLLRCMNYDDTVSFLTNSTPHFRAFRVGIGNPDAATVYLNAGSGVQTISVRHGIELEDGRWVVDYSAIVDGDKYIAGEMVFVLDGEFFYLDEANLTTEATLDGETVEIMLNEVSTREIKMYEVSQGDRIVWTNESESAVTIEVTNADTNIIFDGWASGGMLVGGEDRNVLPIVNMEPGEYTIIVRFVDSEIAYTATIIVTEP
ncbi:MAG: hypothetical protein M9934_11985 [Thermomicrobiales bacterium]|nr:hypothetical protein [Thermomicrobiales bacterium]